MIQMTCPQVLLNYVSTAPQAEDGLPDVRAQYLYPETLQLQLQRCPDALG